MRGRKLDVETPLLTYTCRVQGMTQTWTPEDRKFIDEHLALVAERLVSMNVLPRTQRGTLFRVEIPPGYVYKFYTSAYAKKGTPLYEAQQREMIEALAEFEAEYGEEE